MTEELFNNLEEGDGGGPATVLGDFKIIRLIGKGGMARVYEAEQQSLKRRVALKVLPAHLTLHDEAVQRFRREAEAGSRQSHPGIVAVYAVDEAEGFHYIAEELVEGETSLADQLDLRRKEDELPIGYYRESATITAAVADALTHAHESGVIHRDVKPSNILMTPDGRPKVSDFGLAKVENALALSRTGDFMGTPFYMSPEQAMAHRIDIDHRTDVYSLGVTLYEQLTLQRPFEGKTSQEVLKKIIFIEPKDPCRLNARAPRDLAVICLKAMEKNPNRRYQSTAEFKADLERYLQGEMVHARPAGWGVRMGKWIRRHPTAAAVAGVVVLAGLLLALNFSWSLREVFSERNKVRVVNDFMERMLSSPDPDRDGRQVKVVEILDSAAAEARTSFPDQPEIEAEIHHLLGVSYEALGLYDAAEVEQRTALELRRTVLGETHEETLRSMNDLASVLLHLGRFQVAEPLVRSAWQEWREILGDDHDLTLTARNNLAGALQGQDRYEEAETIYRELVDQRTRLYGESDPNTLRVMNNLAAVLIMSGQPSQAEQMLQRVIEIGRSEQGADHTITLNARSNLASLLVEMGRYAEAESTFDALLEAQIEKYGRGHDRVLNTLFNMADMMQSQRRFAEAEPLCRKAWEGRCLVFGEGHASSVAALNKLGNVLLMQKKYDEAAALFCNRADCPVSSLAVDHPDRLTFHTICSRSLVAQKLFDQAEPHMLAYYEGMKKMAEQDSAMRNNALKNLVGFYEAWGQPEKAAPYKALLTEAESVGKDE